MGPLDLALAFVADRVGRPADERERSLLAAAFDEVAAARREAEAPAASAPAPLPAADEGAVA